MTKPTLDLENLTLAQGAHTNPDAGMCLLEAASYVAGEKFSDHPVCVSTVLGSFGRVLNDRLGQADRQRLKPFIPAMLNTANDGQDEARRYLAADWAIRVSLPRWLELSGRTAAAQSLRELLPITSYATLDVARVLVRGIYDGDLYEARRVAYAGLRIKVREAVRAEFAKAGVKPVAAAAVAVAVAVAEAAVAVAEAAAVAEAVVAVAVAAEVAAVAEVVAAEVAAAADFVNYGPSYYAFRRQVREAIRAKFDALDATQPGTFAYVRKINLDEGIALLGRMIDPSAAAA